MYKITPIVDSTFYDVICDPHFIADLGRSELFDNKTSYFKAVRVTLISLGFDRDIINGRFRECLERFYED